MKKIILKIFCCCIAFMVNGQNKQKFDYELLGNLVLKTGELYSYKIVFSAADNNFINGYSYTDLGGEHETKSYISGYFDAKTKKIQFKEKDILYTKSEFLPEEFCFVSFKGKFKGNTKKKTLSGDFVGIYNDKDTCATGKLLLLSEKFVEKKINKVFKKINKVNKIKKVDSTVLQELKPEVFLKKFSETNINSGEQVSVFMYTNKMKVEIWDYGIEDGDVISIEQNNKIVLDNFLVTRRKKTVTFNLIDGKNEFKIITKDTGKLKTNTTKLKFYDYRREYEVLANLEKDKPATINVVRIKVKKK